MKISRREALLSAGVLAAASALPVSAVHGNDDRARLPQTSQPLATIGPELASLGDFEEMAKTKLPHMAWEFFNGAVADEITMRWNKEAYQKIRLKPRILVDVSKLDTRVTLFGKEHAFPILLAPTAYHKLAHPEGELATARGAGAADVTLIVSTVATTSIEDIAGVAKSPLWFQLYVQQDLFDGRHADFRCAKSRDARGIYIGAEFGAAEFARIENTWSGRVHCCRGTQPNGRRNL